MEIAGRKSAQNGCAADTEHLGVSDEKDKRNLTKTKPDKPDAPAPSAPTAYSSWENWPSLGTSPEAEVRADTPTGPVPGELLDKYALGGIGVSRKPSPG